jgi:hypothetical protein
MSYKKHRCRPTAAEAPVMHTAAMNTENIPIPASPERPPLAPHDPPDPAPQAAAWLRALKVVGAGIGTGTIAKDISLIRTRRRRLSRQPS